MMNVLLVWKKEMLNTVRDKRTLTMMVIVPVLIMPLMMVGLPFMIFNQMEQVEESAARIHIQGAQHAPGLVEFLEGDERLEFVTEDNAEQSLADGNIEVLLTLPEGFSEQAAAGQTVTADIAFEGSRMRSSSARAHVGGLLSTWSGTVVEQRMTELGVDQALLNPLNITSRNVAPAEKMSGAFMAMIVPMMLVMWAILGGMYTAIDVAAGEKERLTLEALLISPVSRFQLVFGKFLAVVVTSVGAALITLTSMILSVQLAPLLVGEGSEVLADVAMNVSPLQFILLLAVALLTAGWASAIEMALSVYARNFKEAQTYLSPLSIIVVIPAVMTQMVEAESASIWYYMAPIFNAIFAIKELLMGVINWGNLAMVAGSSLVYIVLALAVTVYMFGKEKVLFRS